MLHIIERFLLHFVSSAFIVMCFYLTLKFWMRRNRKVSRWISADQRHLLVTCALLVFTILPLREPFDIYMGNNSFIKSCFDQLSWFVGGAVSAWGIYRVSK